MSLILNQFTPLEILFYRPKSVFLMGFRKLDVFTKNIILVFIGASLTNFLNLLYQLLIVHKLTPSDFAAFNSLLAILTLVSTPLSTLQTVTAKYCSEFNARKQPAKIRFLLSGLSQKTFILATAALFVFLSFSNYIMHLLKISCLSCGYILSVLLALSCLSPVFLGGLQGLELFSWFVSGALLSGMLKLVLAIIFVLLGFGIAGALNAFLISSLVSLAIFYFPLRGIVSLRTPKQDINYNQILAYLFPVAISSFCFITLVNLDMVLVKYYFSPQEAGIYSLAQMLGKIFLFLPLAISTVMFPRVSALNAKNMDSIPTLKKSLLYATILCIISVLGYNLFPALVFKILTGKVYPEAIALGRLFSISMSFFTLLYVLINYFLSQNNLGFIKYLALFTLLEYVTIVLFHKNLTQIQLILCLNAILLFFIHLVLVFKKGFIPQGTVPELM